MTINQLIKKLQKIEKTHGKRLTVAVHIKPLARHAEDYSHWSIGDVSVDTIGWERDDSFYRADGSERLKTVVVLE